MFKRILLSVPICIGKCTNEDLYLFERQELSGIHHDVVPWSSGHFLKDVFPAINGLCNSCFFISSLFRLFWVDFDDSLKYRELVLPDDQMHLR